MLPIFFEVIFFFTFKLVEDGQGYENKTSSNLYLTIKLWCNLAERVKHEKLVSNELMRIKLPPHADVQALFHCRREWGNPQFLCLPWRRACARNVSFLIATFDFCQQRFSSLTVSQKVQYQTHLVNPSIAPGTVPINGLEIADAGGEGILFITGVPTGVEVAIGLLADRIT